MIRRILVALAMVFATSAHATWYEATSNNFVVYSEGSEQEARDFAARLERFRFVLKTFRPIEEGRASARLRVFLLPDAGAVGRMAGGADVAGYYVPDARGLMLVGTRHKIGNHDDPRSMEDSTADIPDPEDILFHEYTHHFTFQYFPATYPVWYSEGFAEFWGKTAILPGDVVEVGAPADHRYSTFRYLGWLPLDQLLRAHNYAELGVKQEGGFWSATCSNIPTASVRSTNICA